ncbi:MAG: LysE family transporter [Reinekea sp.]|nr:LysE family transporter [Reinekea sp.]
MFFKGIVIGVVIAMPVGPVGTLCVQRTITQGKINGFLTGLGATTADVVFGLIAAFGLTVVSNFLIDQQEWIRLVGGIIICLIGVQVFSLETQKKIIPITSPNPLNAFGSAFLIAITNPITIITFVVMFAGLGLVGSNSQYGPATLTVFGVFVGSGLIWLSVWGMSLIFRERFEFGRMKWINKIAGIVILVFGVSTLISLIPFPTH